MKKSQPLGECLHIAYSSRLAPAADYIACAEICRAARCHHLIGSVSSVLLFDGQRFCQWLQGEPAAVEGLMRRIAQDTRHTAVSTRLHARMHFCALAQCWRAGFVDSDARDGFQKFEGTAPDQVLSALGRLLAAADLEPALSPALPFAANPTGRATAADAAAATRPAGPERV